MLQMFCLLSLLRIFQWHRSPNHHQLDNFEELSLRISEQFWFWTFSLVDQSPIRISVGIKNGKFENEYSENWILISVLEKDILEIKWKLFLPRYLQLTNQERWLNAYAQPLVNSFTICRKGHVITKAKNRRANKNCLLINWQDIQMNLSISP